MSNRYPYVCPLVSRTDRSIGLAGDLLRFQSLLQDEPASLLNIVAYIQKLGCSLRSLRLAFTFDSTNHTSNFPNWDFAMTALRLSILSESAGLIKVISDLNVESSIEVLVSSHLLQGVSFEAFSNRIATEKRWIMCDEGDEEDDQDYEAGVDDADSEEDEVSEEDIDDEDSEEDEGDRDKSDDEASPASNDERAGTESEGTANPGLCVWTWTLVPADKVTKEHVSP